MHSIMHALPHVCMQAVAGVGLEGGAAMIRRRRLQYIYIYTSIYIMCTIGIEGNCVSWYTWLLPVQVAAYPSSRTSMA